MTTVVAAEGVESAVEGEEAMTTETTKVDPTAVVEEGEDTTLVILVGLPEEAMFATNATTHNEESAAVVVVVEEDTLPTKVLLLRTEGLLLPVIVLVAAVKCLLRRNWNFVPRTCATNSKKDTTKKNYSCPWMKFSDHPMPERPSCKSM